MGIGTFGSFTQARLAIYAAQTGMSVTGNNISNINTPGYTRQRLNQVSLSVAGSDRWYAQGDVRSGQGVLAKSISQIRNPYLDIRFREENAKVGYFNAKIEGLDSIAKILDEVGKGVDAEEGFGVVGLEISKLIASLQDLATQTGHQEYDNIVRQVASNLVSRLNSYAARLEEVRQNTITSFDKNVDRINDILKSIRSYNEEIRKSEIHGDPALEMRDERNLLIDELSGLIDIDVTYSEEEIAAGLSVEKLTIRLGNANPDGRVETDESVLVDGIYCAQLSKGKPMENEYYQIDKTSDAWKALEAQLRAEIDAELRGKTVEGEDGEEVYYYQDLVDVGMGNVKDFIDKLTEDIAAKKEELDGLGDGDTDAKDNLEKEIEKLEGLQKLAQEFETERESILEDRLDEYWNSPYLRQETDANGKVTTTLETDIRNATVLRGENNENFDLIVTALQNKIGELQETMKKVSSETTGDGTSHVIKGVDADGNLIYGSLESMFAEGKLRASWEIPDYPSKGDTTIMVCNRVQGEQAKNPDGSLKTTTKLVDELDENGDPVIDEATGLPKQVEIEVPVYEYTYTLQTYEQVVSKPVALDDNDLGGEIQALRELLTEKGEFVDETVFTGLNGGEPIDENALSKRGIQYYQRSLDLLANQLAKVLNEANQGFYVDPSGNYVSAQMGKDDKGEDVAVPVTIEVERTVKNDDGTESKIIDVHTLNQNDDLSKDPELRDALLKAINPPDGDDLPADITDKEIISAYLKGQTYDEDNGKFKDPDPDAEGLPRGIFVGGVLFSNSGNSDDPTGITASNISISKTWLTEHILVRDFVCPVGKQEPASGKSDNILHMKYLLDTQKFDFNAKDLASTSNAADGPMFNGTIFEFWNNVGFTMGKDQDYANTELTVAYETALSIDTDRSSVSSVDFNDEAMNLMMYSKAYNAACRLMTTIDSMVDKLVNGTGMTT